MHRSHLIALRLIALLFLVASCSSEIGEQVGGDGDGGGGGGGGDCGDEFCPEPDATVCDEVRPIEIEEALPPDLLLVVDRSGSMGGGKWNSMRGALQTALGNNTDTINFGLMLFPGSGDCGAGNINTPVSPTSNANISAALNQVNPNGGTPTDTSLENALTYYQGTTVNPNGRFVLLATDGQPNCGGSFGDSETISESVAAIGALHTAGIPTFVLGLGSGVDASTLQAMANAGGQSQYYSADSQTEIDAALEAITANVALPECSFSLGEVPADPARLRLYFDTDEVARSTLHTDGWDYDEATNTLTIYGASCDQLQGGTVGEVHVDYGCGGTQID